MANTKPTTAAGAQDDKILVALAGAFCAIEEAMEAIEGETEADEAQLEHLKEMQAPLLEGLVQTPAAGLVGLCARARALASYAPDLLRPREPVGTVERLTAALLRDLLPLNAG